MPTEQLPGVEVDDPTQPDETPQVDVDDDDDGSDENLSPEEILRRALKPEDSDEPGEDDEPEDKAPEKPAAQKPGEQTAKPGDEAPAEPAGKTFTQAELDRHISDRLARERANRERDLQPVQQELQMLRDLIATTGKSPQQLAQEARQARIQQIQDESGVDPEQAARWAELEERDRRNAVIGQTETTRRQAAERQTAYVQQKAAFKAPPHVLALAKRYEGEIDDFSQHGAVIDYTTAVYQIIGQKVASGEGITDVQRTAEQKAIRDMEKRGKASPIPAGGPGGSGGPSVTREMAAMARALGVDPRDTEFQKNVKRQEREKQQRRRG